MCVRCCEQHAGSCAGLAIEQRPATLYTHSMLTAIVRPLRVFCAHLDRVAANRFTGKALFTPPLLGYPSNIAIVATHATCGMVPLFCMVA